MANNKRTAAGDINKLIQVERRRGSVVEKIEGTASQIARYDNHYLNAIQVERHRGSVMEKIKGTASQIARYDNRLNEHKAATKGATSGTKDTSGGTRTASSFEAAPQRVEHPPKQGEDDGVGKLLAGGLNLLKGAAKAGVDAANKIEKEKEKAKRKSRDTEKA